MRISRLFWCLLALSGLLGSAAPLALAAEAVRPMVRHDLAVRLAPDEHRIGGHRPDHVRGRCGGARARCRGGASVPAPCGARRRRRRRGLDRRGAARAHVGGEEVHERAVGPRLVGSAGERRVGKGRRGIDSLRGRHLPSTEVRGRGVRAFLRPHARDHLRRGRGPHEGLLLGARLRGSDALLPARGRASVRLGGGESGRPPSRTTPARRRPASRWECARADGGGVPDRQPVDGLRAPRRAPRPRYAFLRQPDPNLANRYLEATAQYLDMYQRLIGPYPFGKFALVENFWETGYGMPSFTLLGPRVIRMPFILHSSYPHEILHNWWGNSVYVDWETGNWCEGLTAYLADHLVREGQGRGEEYRVRRAQEVPELRAARDGISPLTEFRSRHSAATEAVGYGKCLMLCHMLRRRLGDECSRRALRRFFREQLWRSASFCGPRDGVLRASSGRGSGAASSTSGSSGRGRRQLEDDDRQARCRRATSSLTVTQQLQDGEPYRSRVPVADHAGRRDEARRAVPARSTERVAEIAISRARARRCASTSIREFDLFRRLDLAETPPDPRPSSSGAERVTLVAAARRRIRLRRRLASVRRAPGPARDAGQVQVVSRERASRRCPPTARCGSSGAAIAGAGPSEQGSPRVGAGADRRALELRRDPSCPEPEHSFAYAVRHPGESRAGAGLGRGRTSRRRCRGSPASCRTTASTRTSPSPATRRTNVAKGQWPVAGLAADRRARSLEPMEPYRRAAPCRRGSPWPGSRRVFDPER